MTATAETIATSDPPIVTATQDRTHCDACGAPLDPNVMHRCAANQPAPEVTL